MGSNANFPCRKCHWGGTKVEKESDVLCHACHLAGVARNAEEIRDSLEEQLRLAMLGDLKAVERHKGQSNTEKKTHLSPRNETLRRLLVRGEGHDNAANAKPKSVRY
jgi:methylphosphotriester-DNA--protein-cysteine methyltransferase